MMLDQEKFDKIKRLLKSNPKGCTITELSKKLNTNRNSVAKYLEMLLISGQVEMESFGTAKVYVLSQRVPVSGLVEISSDPILVLDSRMNIVQINDMFLTFFSRNRKDLLGTKLSDHEILPLTHLPLETLIWEVARQGEKVKELSFLKDGKEFVIRIKFIPTVFEDGDKGITLFIEDITLQRQYERNLQLSEARYRAVIEDQTELICRRSPEGLITFVNRAYCRYFGKKPEEMLGKTFDPSLPGQERATLLAQEGGVTNAHPLLSYEQKVVTSGREERCILWTERGLFDSEGTVIELQAVGRDITDIKIAERELQIRQSAIDGSIDGIAIINPARVFTYVNQAFVNILKIRDKNEVIGKTYENLWKSMEYIHPDPDLITREVSSNGRWFGELELKPKGGPLMHFLLSLSRINEPEGNYLCDLISFVDISSQKMIAEAYKTTYEKLQDTIEFFPDAAFIVDRDHRVVAWNSAMEALTDIKKGEILGRDEYQRAFSLYQGVRPVLVDLIDIPAYELAKKYPNVRRFGDTLFVEAFIPTMNEGEGAYLWGRATILTDSEHQPIGAIEMVRDITQWKRAADVRRKP
ncbi:MAG: PAS domain-containing protein [Methanomicrobiales archaeon]|nr:PAS domain-containing protein [Methanomicrobiales archaeon]